MRKTVKAAAALLALGVYCGGLPAAQAQGAKAPEQKKQAQQKPAPQKQAAVAGPAVREARTDCVEGIKSLEMRLISQYPAYSSAFVANYPRLAGDTLAACSVFTAYIVQESGKTANKDNIQANIWNRLNLQGSIPETLKALETFRELMLDNA